MNDPMLDRMVDEMGICGRAERTIETYTGAVRRFQEIYSKPLERLNGKDVRDHLIGLKKRDLGAESLNQAHSAIKFLFEDVMDRPGEIEKIPYHKRGQKLPFVLARRQVRGLILAIPDLKHRTLTMVLYSGGLRVSEGTHLKPHDIDSSRMRILVRGGKGDKDRETLLSPMVLDQLRTYWAIRRPKEWLFPGKNPGKPMNSATIQRIVRQAGRDAGIKKNVTPHVLRHSFATHLLENGTPLPYIQRLLGHKSITTMIYLKVTAEGIDKIVSPLDQLGL